MPKTAPKRSNFASSNEKAKSSAIAKIVQIARKERLSYDDFLYNLPTSQEKTGTSSTEARAETASATWGNRSQRVLSNDSGLRGCAA
jgi:hypothetical protein